MRKLALFCAAAMLVGCGKEASHQGRTVSEWRKDLRDADPGKRRAAAAALGEIGPKAKAAVPDLAAALKDADAQVRVSASQALWSLAGDARGATYDLIAALEDGNADVRLNAAGA